MLYTSKVQIELVAKVAGVSTTTVSRVINRVPTVSEENTCRVRAALEKLKSRPNPDAQRLASTRRSRTGCSWNRAVLTVLVGMAGVTLLGVLPVFGDDDGLGFPSTVTDSWPAPSADDVYIMIDQLSSVRDYERLYWILHAAEQQEVSVRAALLDELDQQVQELLAYQELDNEIVTWDAPEGLQQHLQQAEDLRRLIHTQDAGEQHRQLIILLRDRMGRTFRQQPRAESNQTD